ncbi:hypothetical protein [Bdellovibrio bacteriovorus]|uniref:hypothetical protein n=1 Tax=Bdellovibrio bacteriovorus TaxID=959 RepID=UPI0005A0FFCB|nr:hypothetical protein [Bdellovibrio bacteriovorus]
MRFGILSFLCLLVMSGCTHGDGKRAVAGSRYDDPWNDKRPQVTIHFKIPIVLLHEKHRQYPLTFPNLDEGRSSEGSCGIYAKGSENVEIPDGVRVRAKPMYHTYEFAFESTDEKVPFTIHCGDFGPGSFDRVNERYGEVFTVSPDVQ